MHSVKANKKLKQNKKLKDKKALKRKKTRKETEDSINRLDKKKEDEAQSKKAIAKRSLKAKIRYSKKTKHLKPSLDGNGCPNKNMVVTPRYCPLGIDIKWQKPPIVPGSKIQDRNGAFVSGVISAALFKLQFYEESHTGWDKGIHSQSACRDENERAISALKEALGCLLTRANRIEREVEEGIYAIDDEGNVETYV